MSFAAQTTRCNDNLERYSGHVIRPDYFSLFRGDIRRRIAIGPDRALPSVDGQFLPLVGPGEKEEIIEKSIAFWADFYARNVDSNIEINAETSLFNSDLRG